MDKLYTISEVADKLGLSTKTLRRWEETGKFIGTRTLGGQRRYSLTDIQILDAIKHGTVTGSDDLLTIEQAASLFGVTPTTIARWENDGKIHPLITAGAAYYPRHRLLAKLDELKSTIPPDQTHPFYDEPEPETYRYTAPEPTPPREPERTIHHPASVPVPETVPTLSQQRRTLQPLNAYLPKSSSSGYLIPLNIVITLMLLAGYHIFINSKVETPSMPAGQVQGTATTRDESLILLDAVLDKSGNLHPHSITTASLSLTPAEPPSPIPGSIYFDAGTQSVKVYKSGGWQDLAPTQEITMDDVVVRTGSGTIAKGKDQASISAEKISAGSTVTVTFNSDFSPAKKYWVTSENGVSTVYTDFPVATDSTFTYTYIENK